MVLRFMIVMLLPAKLTASVAAFLSITCRLTVSEITGCTVFITLIQCTKQTPQHDQDVLLAASHH